MRLAALLLGMAGGILGVGGGFAILSAGGIAHYWVWYDPVGRQYAASVVGLGAGVLGSGLLGILGTGLATRRGRAGGLFLVAASLGTAVATSWFAAEFAPGLFFGVPMTEGPLATSSMLASTSRGVVWASWMAVVASPLLLLSAILAFLRGERAAVPRAGTPSPGEGG